MHNVVYYPYYTVVLARIAPPWLDGGTILSSTTVPLLKWADPSLTELCFRGPPMSHGPVITKAKFLTAQPTPLGCC